MKDLDHLIRMAAFDWLGKTADPETGMISWDKLRKGFVFGDQRIILVQQRGIVKPRQLDYPLSIRTSPQDPYGDAFEGADVLLYRYYGQDPMHADNRGLREAMNRQLPLVYLKGISPGKYCAVWPVYIIGDDPANLRFRAVADIQVRYNVEQKEEMHLISVHRGYATAQVKVRLFQLC